MHKNYIFFLGGYDAEMVAIKEILNEQKLTYYDNNLKWGAKLSEYKEELSKITKDQIPVFIELNLDIDYPANSIIIEHHGDKAGKDKKTSIEQVAELLNIELNRKQKLISANDRDYIWGMLELDATEEEIKEIRKMDKQAQGVTEDDEKKAEMSIRHYLKRLSKNVVLIYSLTEKTSPIIDRIYKYYEHIFIISPSDILLYSGSGKGVELLKDYYDDLKKDKPEINYWFGGNLPIRGFFGSNHKLKEKEVIKVMGPLISKERIHSHHIFMFPFEIDSDELNETTSSVERLKKIYERLNSSNWGYEEFKIKLNSDGKNYSPDETWSYNEYYYYYDFVRETIFNKTVKDDLFKDKKKSPISLYFEWETQPDDEMVIFLKTKKFSKNFSLEINHLSLRIFETGIGILTITLYNYCYTDFKDILLINDFGRRIYPQFLGEPDDNVDPIIRTKNAFLADKIVFKINGNIIEEEFNTVKYLNTNANFVRYIEELLAPLHDKNRWRIIPIIDDRMFTICWYENDCLANDLSKKYENDLRWYMFVFIDGNSPGIANNKMMNSLIEKTTYARFSDWGTLYGLSRYSFMCLCSIDRDDDFPYKIIRNHMQKIYYQMFVLLLAQRASIVKYNKQIELISIEADNLLSQKSSIRNVVKGKDLKKILNNVEKLNKDIILFGNRMMFDEVTPQEQGIEIYNLALKNMDIEKQFQNLQNKVKQLYDFINLTLESEKSTRIQGLTFISIIFAIVVCILAFWSIDFEFLRYWKLIEENVKHHPNLIATIILFFSSSLTIVLCFFLVLGLKLKLISEKTGWYVLITEAISALIWIYILYNN